MIDISIVSGTYNRIQMLKRMVESVRASLHFDNRYGSPSYELVVVDGGSVDGTQDWCRSQSDIHLIEHGKLYGAVKAFNDGAYAASGQYVILANDDIEFIGDSILQAWIYMQQHLDTGVGCFYQDRNGRDWHVEVMPVVHNGQQTHWPYGQVCIVPKWLGDSVGWWCDEQAYHNKQHETRDNNIKPLHTYGGDNELSARIYELGFKVSPLGPPDNPLARIHDNETADDLRKLNNITGGKDPRAVKGHHPDSWSWGRKWLDRRTQLVGPVIKDAPTIPNQNPQPKERILYLPIFEPGWNVQREQKRGLREALARVGLVIEYDYVHRFQVVKKKIVDELIDIIQKIKPTIVLTQIHNTSNLDASDIQRLRQAAPNAHFVNWNGDYWPENYFSEASIQMARHFHLNTSVSLQAVEKYQQMGLPAAFWQIGWEPDGRGHEPTVNYDVVFLGSGYSQARHKLVKWLRSLGGFTFGLYGQGWPEGWANGQTLYNFQEGCKIYRGSKISLGDSQWPEAGFVSNRVMQALAAGGAALAHQWFRGMEDLGLVDGETCIIWTNQHDLEHKIRHYLRHEDERRRIAEAGERLALERHSFVERVQELFRMLGKKAEVQAEAWRW